MADVSRGRVGLVIGSVTGVLVVVVAVVVVVIKVFRRPKESRPSSSVEELQLQNQLEPDKKFSSPSQEQVDQG